MQESLQRLQSHFEQPGTLDVSAVEERSGAISAYALQRAFADDRDVRVLQAEQAAAEAGEQEFVSALYEKTSVQRNKSMPTNRAGSGPGEYRTIFWSDFRADSNVCSLS